MGDRVVVLGPEVFGADSCVPRKVDLHQVQGLDPFPPPGFLGWQPASNRNGHFNLGFNTVLSAAFAEGFVMFFLTTG